MASTMRCLQAMINEWAAKKKKRGTHPPGRYAGLLPELDHRRAMPRICYVLHCPCLHDRAWKPYSIVVYYCIFMCLGNMNWGTLVICTPAPPVHFVTVPPSTRQAGPGIKYRPQQRMAHAKMTGTLVSPSLHNGSAGAPATRPVSLPGPRPAGHRCPCGSGSVTSSSPCY